MERAPLRPVPARPAGPIEPATALRDVSSWLPTLAPEGGRALALVVLAERPRAEVASTLRVSDEELGELLAEARKELRQTLVVLSGTGWCERAEGLISDRLDGALADRDARRLDVHLRNCHRCVEHERRLVQATDALVMRAGGRAPIPGARTDAAPLVEAPPPADAVAPENDGIEEAVPEEPTAPTAPPGRSDARQPIPAASASPETADAPQPAPTAPAPEEHVAAAAEVLVAARTRRQIAGAVVWNSLIALAILLALATIALTIAGILGAQL